MKSKATFLPSPYKQLWQHRSLIFFIVLLLLYIVAMLSIIRWGIPGTSIAYPYEMDEWHHFAAVAALFKHFTNNIPGAERGPSFFFIVSGIYLAPFVLFHIIHLSTLSHHFTTSGLIELNHLFIILRSLNVIFGILTLSVIYLISKYQLRINPIIAVIFFGATPLWISWTDIYKYDIAVTFWIVLSIYFILRYRSNPNGKNYLLAGLISALAPATKISAISIIPLYFIAFFLFTPKPFKNISILVIGLIIFGISFALFGIPDVLFLRVNWGDYVAGVVGSSPNAVLGMPWYLFLLFEHYPIIFGQGLYFLALVSGVYYVIKVIKVSKKNFVKKYGHLLFLTCGLVLFSTSLISYGFGASGQRLLVVLPFIALLTAYAVSRMIKINKYIFISLIFLIVIVQLFESYALLAVRYGVDPRVASSLWISKHVKPKSIIALENVPIYHGIPNTILLDYYQNQSSVNKGIYRYEVVTDKITDQPDYVVLTDSQDTQRFIEKSTKKALLNQLKYKHYHLINSFIPDHSLFLKYGDERNFFFNGIVPTNSIEIYAKKQ